MIFLFSYLSNFGDQFGLLELSRLTTIYRMHIHIAFFGLHVLVWKRCFACKYQSINHDRSCLSLEVRKSILL